MSSITAALIRRYDRPGPRYTSYPTAAEFHSGIDASRYHQHLCQAASREQPLGLYIHLPFCAERCLYCGCNVVITRKRAVAEHYLEILAREIRMVAERLGDRRRLRQLHWGGGTPTYLTPAELRALAACIRQEFDLDPGAEVAIEIDPRVSTREHLEALRELGFNRLSLGVQDFTPEVQELIHRVQSYEQTAELIETARNLGFASINLDLIYGLPLQTPETFVATLRQVTALRPQRVAVYSYAHVPWLKVQQRRIPAETLPAPEVKLELLAEAIHAFHGAGYRAIGMDHFALPEDELGRALDDGSLWRNFMGYTMRQAPDMVACGMSGISDVAGAYFQNESKLIRYQHAIEQGRLATARGVALSADDLLRRHVITALMCTFRLSFADVERRFDIDFARTFPRELEALETLEIDGFLKRSDTGIDVTGLGRLFVRNVCMVFDAYLERAQANGQRFSRTV